MSEDSLLLSGAAELGFALTPAQCAAFRQYHGFLAEQNALMDLTAITGWEDTVRLHFLDSLAPLAWAPETGTVMDLGSGAGFPGVPMAILRPGLGLTLLDAKEKRVDFLRELCRRLGVEARCVAARGEEYARGPARDSFDMAVSRAVARLNVLCELCLPFVRPGGVFVALKGAAAREEAREAGEACRLLGAGPPELRDYPIPGTDIVHRAVVIRKERPTPEEYPRRFPRIMKRPL